MQEFRELEDYQLFYEELSSKKKPSARTSPGETGAPGNQASLNEKQISLLRKDLQQPIENRRQTSNPLE